MEARMQTELTVLPSVCDLEAKLSVADVFGLFMDIAAAHADALGLGADAMISRGLFWLTVKTKVRLFRRPRLMERVTVHTRPLAPEKVRSIREYRLTCGGEVLAEGKTEWAVMEIQSGRIHPMGDVFSPELELGQEPEMTEPFRRIPPDFSGEELLGTYRVRSTDIDLGGHMNNVAYLRAILGLLPGPELRALPQAEVEIAFRAPCFEGETLEIRRRVAPEGWDFAALKPDDTPAVLVRTARQTTP